MNTNFEEKQAFEDLREILNHMKTFADHYYAEMQMAQKLNAEKDFVIEKLKADYEEKLEAKDNEIADLKDKIFSQEDAFKEHLNEYGNYNMDLTKTLNQMKDDLEAKKNELDKKADELEKDEEKLKKDRDALNEERRKFYEEKESMQAKVDNYNQLQKSSEKFDQEKKELMSKIAELEKNQQTCSNEDVQKLKDEVEHWQNKANNLQSQLNQVNSGANNNSSY